MKSFGGKRVGGWGEENLWLWGKKKDPSYPKRETRKKKGWWCCVIPFSLSSVLSVEEDERREEKKEERKLEGKIINC